MPLAWLEGAIAINILLEAPACHAGHPVALADNARGALLVTSA